jgi:hypothetical protein
MSSILSSNAFVGVKDALNITFMETDLADVKNDLESEKESCLTSPRRMHSQFQKRRKMLMPLLVGWRSSGK